MAHGHFGWHDLNTRDVDGALAFHGALFGWTVARVDQTPGGTYTVLDDGTAPFGGVLFMTDAWDGMDPH